MSPRTTRLIWIAAAVLFYITALFDFLDRNSGDAALFVALGSLFLVIAFTTTRPTAPQNER